MEEREAEEYMEKAGGGIMHEDQYELGRCVLSIKMDCWC